MRKYGSGNLVMMKGSVPPEDITSLMCVCLMRASTCIKQNLTYLRRERDNPTSTVGDFNTLTQELPEK